MRLSPLVSASFAVLVLIAWFLWPFSAVSQEPLGSALAALRAIALFLITLQATTVIADLFPIAPRPILRSAIAFVIALSIGMGAGFGFALFTGRSDAPIDWWSLLEAAAADALWCAVAVRLYYFFRERSVVASQGTRV